MLLKYLVILYWQKQVKRTVQTNTEAAILLQRWWRRILVDLLVFFDTCNTLNLVHLLQLFSCSSTKNVVWSWGLRFLLFCCGLFK